jgi:hypothetical protein
LSESEKQNAQENAEVLQFRRPYAR